MTAQTDALDEAVRRFPRLLTMAKAAEERGCNWALLQADLLMLRSEYLRCIRELRKAAAVN